MTLSPDIRLRAWAWADSAREREARTAPRGTALVGYTIGVKDVIDVAGMPTRSGSPLTSRDPAPADAPVVARLRAAGAAIVGKTQCTEWALNDPAPTRNPWRRDRTPGGSSAGSAVAVVTGMCTATVDTQTAGDVVRPAAYNGVVGLKPTFGWAPLAGTQLVAPSVDTIGLMARGVEEAAAVAAVVADEEARFQLPETPTPPTIGVLRDPYYEGVSAEVGDNLAEVVRCWKEEGATVHDTSSPADLAPVHAAHRVIVFAECAALHRDRYRRESNGYGRRARELVELGLRTPAHAYLHAQAVRRRATEGLATLFRDVDVVVTPAAPGPAPARDTTGDSHFQIPWTLCGFPTLALPCGHVAGLPVAVQLVARRHHEPTLLSAARWCQRAQNSALRGVLGNGMTSRTLPNPVA